MIYLPPFVPSSVSTVHAHYSCSVLFFAVLALILTVLRELAQVHVTVVEGHASSLWKFGETGRRLYVAEMINRYCVCPSGGESDRILIRST